MESKRNKIRRRSKKPKSFVRKLGRLTKRQIGKNEQGEYQWEIIVGVSLAVVLALAFIAYVYLNINRG